MSLYYQANEVKKKNKLQTWRKGQTGWKVGFPILTSISILCVMITIVFCYILVHLLEKASTEGVPVMTKFTIGIVSFLFLVISGVIIQAFWIRMFRKTAQPYEERKYEFIRFGDTELILGHHYKYHKITNSMVEYRLPYESIKDIELHKYYGKLQIIGKIIQTEYEDYSAGIISARNESRNGIVSTLLYFDEEENLLKELEKRVGFEINRISDSRV